MKKVVIEKPGSYDRLQIKEFQKPKPAKDELLIEVKAAGVNFADCCVRMGVYSSAKEFVGWPITPGFEVSGVVLETGPDVKHYKKGDRVIALTLFGGYTTHLISSEKFVFPLPEMLNFSEGAAFPVVFLTAFYALFEQAHPKKKDKILVHSAAGGVGSSLVQFCRLMEAEVTGVVGAPKKIDLVKSLGAHQVIDKSAKNLWEEAEKIAPDGFDVILDANGVETLRESYKHLAPGGKLVVYGFHTMFSKGLGRPNWLKIFIDYLKTPRFNPLKMTQENRSVLAFNLSYLFNRFEPLKEAANQILLPWILGKKVVIPPITTYPFEQVAKAHRDLESGLTQGKLVLTM